MASGSKEGKEQIRLGFMTAVEIGDRSYVGGLLITDRLGRPLEFQCTTPVKPNRTQELLYGPTLVPFILGDLLGTALLDRVSVKPLLVMTSRIEMLQLRTKVDVPIIYDEASSETDSKATQSEQPVAKEQAVPCLLYTSPSPRDRTRSRMPSSA